MWECSRAGGKKRCTGSCKISTTYLKKTMTDVGMVGEKSQ
jgi:hypothetical protein